ncbi:MAG: glycosyltransferase involved in cell wall biosynthesis [Paraglaciecola sp.]|jgi:glycosyltransferase involved in cell wall biosynthesis
MKKHILISHFKDTGKFSNGVINYTKSMSRLLDTTYNVLSNEKNLDKESFQREVYRNITGKYDCSSVIIEAAESQASTLLLPKEYMVHIRMHCPYHLYQKVIKVVPDEVRYSSEIRAINKAKASSSPSHTMLEHLTNDLNADRIHVFKNPLDPSIEYAGIDKKDIDVLFLLRFNNLKGIEYINPVLMLLPSTFNVTIAGRMDEEFVLDSRVDCNVNIITHTEGEEKTDLLNRAKVSLSLSKFENCSMVILESIAAGTPVVCWNVGGNAEIAKSPIVNPFEFEDVFAYSARVIELVKFHNYPTKAEFLGCREEINGEFISGVQHVEKFMRGDNEVIFKGIDHRKSHEEIAMLPYELLGHSYKELSNRPIKILYLVKTKKYFDILSQYHQKYSIPCDVICFPNISDCTQKLDTVHLLSEMNWVVNQSNLISIIKKNRYELVVLENPKFSSEDMKNGYIARLNVPVTCAEAHDGGNIFVDRFGWGKSSHFSNRKINLRSENIKYTIFDRVVAVTISKNTISIVYKLSELKKQLIIQNVYSCILIGENSDLYYDEFFIKGVHDGEITDLITLTDDHTRKFLESNLNIYIDTSSIFNNKGVGHKIDISHFELFRDIFFCIENRQRAAELYDFKCISMKAKSQNFTEEYYTSINRVNHKKGARQ